MLAFIPILNECDIFSVTYETIKIMPEEYNEYAKEKEVFFGHIDRKKYCKLNFVETLPKIFVWLCKCCIIHL
jgi:hypothetical protein